MDGFDFGLDFLSSSISSGTPRHDMSPLSDCSSFGMPAQMESPPMHALDTGFPEALSVNSLLSESIVPSATDVETVPMVSPQSLNPQSISSKPKPVRKRKRMIVDRESLPINFVKNQNKPNTPRRRPPGGDFRRTKQSDIKCARCSAKTGTDRFKRTALNFGGCFCVHACGGGRNGDPHMHHPPQNRSCSRLLVPDCMRCPCPDVVKTRFEPAPGLPREVLEDMWVCEKHTVPDVYSLEVYQECDRIVRERGGCGKRSVGFHMLSCDLCQGVLEKVLAQKITENTGCSVEDAKKIAEPLQHHQIKVVEEVQKPRRTKRKKKKKRFPLLQPPPSCPCRGCKIQIFARACRSWSNLTP